MKYYATETVLKNKESEKLNDEIAKFLANGGKIDKRNNLGQSIDENGNLVDFKKSELTARFNGALSEDYKEKQKKSNKGKSKDKEDRIKVQQEWIAKYLRTQGTRAFWKSLIDECDQVVSSRTLVGIHRGETAIICPDKWRKVRDAIDRIIAKQGSMGDRMNLNNVKSAIEAKERIQKQRPLFLEVRQYYGKHSWSTLSKRLNGLMSASHLSDCFAGKNSVKNPQKWRKIKSEMIKMIEEKKNEAQVA